MGVRKYTSLTVVRCQSCLVGRSAGRLVGRPFPCRRVLVPPFDQGLAVGFFKSRRVIPSCLPLTNTRAHEPHVAVLNIFWRRTLLCGAGLHFSFTAIIPNFRSMLLFLLGGSLGKQVTIFHLTQNHVLRVLTFQTLFAQLFHAEFGP